MYWIPSNLFSMLQNYVLRIPSVKKFFGIPEPVATSSADVIAKRNQDNAITNILQKFFPKTVKDMKTDLTGVKLMSQEELHKIKKK